MPDLTKPTPPSQGPVVPTPVAGVMALVLTGCIPLNIYLDFSSADYNGAQVNYLLSLLIGGILGVDITRGWKRRKNEDAEL